MKMELDMRFITGWILVSIVLIFVMLFATPLIQSKSLKIVAAILAPVVSYIVLSLNRNR